MWSLRPIIPYTLENQGCPPGAAQMTESRSKEITRHGTRRENVMGNQEEEQQKTHKPTDDLSAGVGRQGSKTTGLYHVQENREKDQQDR